MSKEKAEAEVAYQGTYWGPNTASSVLFIIPLVVL